MSSASVILDQPSGEYVVLINGGMRKSQETLEAWKSFFGGEEIAYIFEDIACSVAAGDVGALEMARSFQSRLPENQMQIRTEDATLLMSRADHGKFDVLIMSKEFSEAYHGETVPKEGLEWISLN